jgi:methylated-DNA-protein-cysteine methyltransferase related protein
MASDYYERVWDVVQNIPEGKVTTYGAIAGFLGVRSGARMVGYALNHLLEADRGSQPLVPAHRVVNRLGCLSGRSHFPGDTMRERLEQEGVSFIEDYRVDMKKHFWDPSEKSW